MRIMVHQRVQVSRHRQASLDASQIQPFSLGMTTNGPKCHRGFQKTRSRQTRESICQL